MEVLCRLSIRITLFKMAKKKEFTPNFGTAEADHCKEELNKRASGGFVGNLREDFRDGDRDDVAWESEQVAKSHGIYLEFNRAKTGGSKEWSYMIRVTVPGGWSDYT